MYTAGDFNTHKLVLRRQENRVDGTEHAECIKMAAVIGSVFLVRKATVSNMIGHPTPNLSFTSVYICSCAHVCVHASEHV